MITGPKYKICRRLGSGVFEKCQTQKFTMSEARKEKNAGRKRKKAPSDFGAQLIEKQRVRFNYGLSEKQFSNYVKQSMEGKHVATEALFEKMETRLDNVVYRSGFAHTRALARQMVSHGHFTVNGRRVNVPSYQVKPGDVVQIREGSRNKVFFQDLAKKLKNYVVPEWLKTDVEQGRVEIKTQPKNAEQARNLSSVIEFYSR